MIRTTHKRQKANELKQAQKHINTPDRRSVLKRTLVLFVGLLPFIWCLITSMMGLSLVASSKRGYAFVNTDETSLAVRLSAGTDGLLLDRLQRNSQVLVTGAAVDSKGESWYEIKYLRAAGQYRTGFVHSDYLTFYNDIAPAGEDPEFEVFMSAQGFPDSYKVLLRILHKQHPTWIFNAQHLDMDWNYALSSECEIDTSMVQLRLPYSWRSMEEGSYLWDSNTA